MITYDAGYWGVACIFQLHGSVFPKALVWAIPCSIIAGVLHYLLGEYTELKDNLGVGDAAASVFGGFNFILGFLVVFRSQQAYARWWEGGTLLQQLRGEWFNSFSCLVAFCNSAQDKKQDVEKFQQQMVRLFSLLYGSALMQVSQMNINSFEVINLDGFDADSLKFLKTCPDKCEVTLQWIQRLIVESEQKQILKIAPPILSRVYNELGNGIVNLNNARKIKDFPIPFPLAQMIMVMLMFHAFFTPLICAATVTKTAWACLLTFAVTFSFWTVLYIAVELEMPYGEDPNDLPLRDMATDMNRSLLKMMEPQAQEVPAFDMEATSTLVAGDMDLDLDISVVGRSKNFPPDKGALMPVQGAAAQPLRVEAFGGGGGFGGGFGGGGGGGGGAGGNMLPASENKPPLVKVASEQPPDAKKSTGTIPLQVASTQIGPSGGDPMRSPQATHAWSQPPVILSVATHRTISEPSASATPDKLASVSATPERLKADGLSVDPQPHHLLKEKPSGAQQAPSGAPQALSCDSVANPIGTAPT